MPRRLVMMFGAGLKTWVRMMMMITIILMSIVSIISHHQQQQLGKNEHHLT
jgi:hypothetical protein